jgi:hypothetical protein
LEAAAGGDAAALDALHTQGVPWAVADEEQAQAIHERYTELLNAEVARRVAPLAAELRAQGHVVTEFTGMPALSTLLTRPEIEKLAGHPLVAEIFLIEAEGWPESDVAVATGRVPQVWQRGYNGAGVKIAILEAGNINQTVRACLNVTATRDPGMASNDHKSRVAAIAACSNAALPGVAKGASVLDAGFDDSGSNQQDNERFTEAVIWAAQTQTADVINISYGFDSTTSLHFTDRVADYWARWEKITIVKSAGNFSTSGNHNVTSPGKGWNVIAVGRASDQNTANWSDDTLDGDSAYVNPATGVEKPELAAPGTNINTVVGLPASGTSFAAPQVAGVAALLMHRNTALKDQPSAVKAILMAAAVHNLEGDRTLSSADGAGAIDAALADQIAQSQGATNDMCNQPCWWQKNTVGWDPSFSNPLSYTFAAARGERIRVAIAWLSNADGPAGYATDTLFDNFEVRVYQPNLQLVASSLSTSNNFEIVEFVAPATSEYRIEISRRYASNLDPGVNQLGIAWSKQATYLPDVRQNIDGWNSTITVRNDDAMTQSVSVTFYPANGAPVVNSNTLGPNQNWQIAAPSGLGYGFAVLDGSENLSAVVEQVGASQVSAYSGVQANPLGDPLWATTGGSLALPYVYKSYYGYTSNIRLLNTGAQAASGMLSYYDLNGFPAGQTPFTNRAALSAWTVQPSTGDGFYGSVAIQSTQPLAVLSDAYNTAIDISTQAGAGATSAYLPYIMRNYGGWNSCFVVRNLDNATNNVTITYYHSAGTTVESQSIAANAMWTRCQQSIGGMPDGPLSARIVSTSNRPFVLAINQSQVSAGKHMSYNGSQQGSRVVILPVLRRNHTENNRAWSSGFQVQNAGDGTGCFAVSYFKPTGESIAGQSTGCLNQGYAQGFYLPNVTVNGMNDGLWSAVVTATQSIVVVANATCTSGCSGDNVYAYNGFRR